MSIYTISSKRRNYIDSHSTQLFLLGVLVVMVLVLILVLIMSACFPVDSIIWKKLDDISGSSALLISGGMVAFLVFWSWFSQRIAKISVANAMRVRRKK